MNRLKLFAATAAVALLVPAVADAQAVRRGDVLDANTASEKQLLSVPGVTPALARGILARRPFLTMSDFDALLGESLSREQRAETYRRVFVQINLNAATDA